MPGLCFKRLMADIAHADGITRRWPSAVSSANSASWSGGFCFTISSADGAFYLHLLRDRREHLQEGRHALRQRQIDALRFRRYRQARVAQGERYAPAGQSRQTRRNSVIRLFFIFSPASETFRSLREFKTAGEGNRTMQKCDVIETFRSRADKAQKRGSAMLSPLSGGLDLDLRAELDDPIRRDLN